MKPFNPVIPIAVTNLFSLLGIPDRDARCDGIGIQAGTGNAASVFLGSAALQPLELVAGASSILPTKSVKNVFVKGNGTDTLAVLLFD